MAKLPRDLHWLFWETNPEALETEAHGEYVLARILEQGRLADVRWALATYGIVRIHRFFRDVGHPELSARTISFWRAALQAEDEVWNSPPAWRRTSSAPWID